MKILDRFFRRKKTSAQRPAVSSLREQIASDIKMFASVRGRGSLLKAGTAVVMSDQYETFVTKDVSRIANRAGIVALVYMKNVKCYEQVRTIQAEDLRGNAGALVLNNLAREVAAELLRQAAEQGHPPGFRELGSGYGAETA